MPMVAHGAPVATPEPAIVQEKLERVGEAAASVVGKAAGLVQSEPWLWSHVLAAVVVIVSLLFADVIRPGSLERSGKRDVNAFSSITWFLCALLVYGAMIVGAQFAIYMPDAWRGPEGTLQREGTAALVQYGIAIIAGLLLARLIHQGSKSAGMGVSAKSLAWGALAGLLAWPVVIASGVGFIYLHHRLGYPPPETNLAHPTLQKLVENKHDWWAWGLAGLAIIGAPIVEELIYRGFVQSALLKFTHRAWLSLLLSSGLFMAVHLVPMGSGAGHVPWYAAAQVGVLGLCMGIAFERTKDIGVPITMHMLYNLVNVLLAVYAVKPG